MRPCLLSLRMRTYARQHMVKNGYLKRHPLKEARILWLLLRSNHIQMHTPFTGRRRWTYTKRFRAFFWKGRSADFTRDQFTSEHFWVKLSRTMPHVYQMSYPMLIMQRTSFTGIIDYRRFRCVCEPSRIPIRTLKRLRNKNRKIREFVYKTRCVVNGWKRHCGRTLICWEQFRDIRCWQSRCSKRGSRISGIRNQMNIGK